MQQTNRQAALSHYEEMARLGQAFGSPVRLRLLDLLRQAPRGVDALSEQAGLPMANVSQHLRQLRAAKVVTSERRGQRVVYQLAGPMVGSYFVAFRAFAELLLPEMPQLKETIVTTERELSPREFRQMQLDGRAIIVDVRPEAEYLHAHTEGAVSIPIDELACRLHELPPDKLVVTTCRGPYCPIAVEAVTLLRAAGYRAAHVDLDSEQDEPETSLSATQPQTVAATEPATASIDKGKA